MVKDHSDSEKGNLLLPYRLLLSINSKDFYMHHPTERITHTTAFVTPVVEHWLGTRNSSMGSTPWRIDPTTYRAMSERSTSELPPIPTPLLVVCDNI